MQKINGITQHLYAVDILKVFAILCVILAHTAHFMPHWAYVWVVNTNVPVFVIISGYVYSISAHKTGTETIHQWFLSKTLFVRILEYAVPYLIFLGFEYRLFGNKLLHSVWPREV